MRAHGAWTALALGLALALGAGAAPGGATAQDGVEAPDRAALKEAMRKGGAGAGAVKLAPELGDPVRGRALARQFNCVACHGERGQGVKPGWPKLAGQFEQYLLNELRNFRDGQRPHAFMELYAGQLDRRRMHDLALYFACQGAEPGVETIARCAGVRGDADAAD